MDLKKLLSLFVLLFGISLMSAQIPPAPVPPRLVNDFVGVLQPRQVDELEHRLVTFNDTTSNMICVVIVDDMGNYSEHEFAYEIGEKWGVRSRTTGKRNGVVMLVKVKRNKSDFGAAYIAPGYDLEAVLPDAFCKNVADNTMIPRFREGDYYQGIVDALDIILPIIAGEITVEEFEKKPDVLVGIAIFLCFFLLVCVLLIILVIILDKKNRNNGGKGPGGKSFGNDVWKWILIGSLIGGGQGNSSGGNSGGGYSGGGYSGGGFGGFGGFGGSGGFGGAGGGGRW